jgi:ribosomal protein L4
VVIISCRGKKQHHTLHSSRLETKQTLHLLTSASVLYKKVEIGKEHNSSNNHAAANLLKEMKIIIFNQHRLPVTFLTTAKLGFSSEYSVAL